MVRAKVRLRLNPGEQIFVCGGKEKGKVPSPPTPKKHDHKMAGRKDQIV